MLKKVEELADTSNGGRDMIAFSEPYTVSVTIEGVAALLMHRWNNESVAAKADAAKGSKAKKSDDVESYVYRNPEGEIAASGAWMKGAIVTAGRYRQDPRSPRKSAMDLFKAGIVVLSDTPAIYVDGEPVSAWDYLDMRRVVVQRSAITRTRPAMHPGWRTTFDIMVMTPEYINRATLRETIEQAGRLCGIGDFRPSYGRFGIVSFV